MKRGFTTVELITVMVVIGILAAIAIPRIADTNVFSANAYRNEVASALRHAQKSAVSHRRLVCATLTDRTVTLQIASASFPERDPGAACNANYRSPDGTQYASHDTGVVAGGAFFGTGTSTTLFFQPSGEITTDAPGTAFAIGTITITGQPPLVIDGRTGYVE